MEKDAQEEKRKEREQMESEIEKFKKLIELK